MCAQKSLLNHTTSIFFSNKKKLLYKKRFDYIRKKEKGSVEAGRMKKGGECIL